MNAAGFTGIAVAPGEMISIFGIGIGPSEGASWQFVNGVAQTTLAGTQVLFNNTPAPLIYVSAQQINAIVPYEVASQYSPVSMQVLYQGNSTNGVALMVDGSRPESSP